MFKFFASVALAQPDSDQNDLIQSTSTNLTKEWGILPFDKIKPNTFKKDFKRPLTEVAICHDQENRLAYISVNAGDKLFSSGVKQPDHNCESAQISTDKCYEAVHEAVDEDGNPKRSDLYDYMDKSTNFYHLWYSMVHNVDPFHATPKGCISGVEGKITTSGHLTDITWLHIDPIIKTPLLTKRILSATGSISGLGYTSTKSSGFQAWIIAVLAGAVVIMGVALCCLWKNMAKEEGSPGATADIEMGPAAKYQDVPDSKNTKESSVDAAVSDRALQKQNEDVKGSTSEVQFDSARITDGGKEERPAIRTQIPNSNAKLVASGEI